MEEEKKVPKPKGGVREGAGRKPKDKVATQLITVKIRKDFQCRFYVIKFFIFLGRKDFKRKYIFL